MTGRPAASPSTAACWPRFCIFDVSTDPHPHLPVSCTFPFFFFVFFFFFLFVSARLVIVPCCARHPAILSGSGDCPSSLLTPPRPANLSAAPPHPPKQSSYLPHPLLFFPCCFSKRLFFLFFFPRSALNSFIVSAGEACFWPPLGADPSRDV